MAFAIWQLPDTVLQNGFRSQLIVYFRRPKFEMAQPLSSILLIELPTFPKGTVALSLYAVAAALGDTHPVVVLDLNTRKLSDSLIPHKGTSPLFIGLKVSAQNFHLGIEISRELSLHFPSTPIVWGGEYPTLEPEKCLQYCNTVVRGSFESIAKELIDA